MEHPKTSLPWGGLGWAYYEDISIKLWQQFY